MEILAIAFILSIKHKNEKLINIIVCEAICYNTIKYMIKNKS